MLDEAKINWLQSLKPGDKVLDGQGHIQGVLEVYPEVGSAWEFWLFHLESYLIPDALRNLLNKYGLWVLSPLWWLGNGAALWNLPPHKFFGCDIRLANGYICSALDCSPVDEPSTEEISPCPGSLRGANASNPSLDTRAN